ncbi:metallophosphoesterase [Sphingobium sp. ZW T5_29]|uniref:metallophosphoesterase n=1 Tax=Sphingobium sp. ZW T5_29 TaxID=3378077 RepID=UPI003851A906
MIDVTQLPHDEAGMIYAIGDIHGRLDLLDQIEATIADDIAKSKNPTPLICYLGDYIDRGPQSAQVIDRLCSYSGDGVRRLFLKGNHEDRMIDFLVDPIANGPAWMKFGGREALESYGLIVPIELSDADWNNLRDQLNAVLPDSHRNFLSALLLGVRWRGYLLVHAGLNPERPVSAQVQHDLMWIREPFLSSERDWGFKVIHGHVITEQPDFRANRIGIDTGAYQTGCLTCLVLSNDGERLIQAWSPPPAT